MMTRGHAGGHEPCDQLLAQNGTRRRWRSSQPSSTAIARGSWRRLWPAPRMTRRSAVPWASAIDRASASGTSWSSLPCTEQQRPRRELARVFGRSQLAQTDRPLVDRRREVGFADDADEPGVLDEALRVAGPVVEIGGRTERRHASDPQVAGTGADADGTRRCRSRRATRRWPARCGSGARPRPGRRRTSRRARSCPASRWCPAG